MNYIIKLLINALGVVIAAYLIPGVTVAHFGYAVAVAFTLSILNISIKPILVVLTLPVTIVSLGLFLLLINTAMILLAARIIGQGFMVDGWWTAFLFSILLSILNSILERLINVEAITTPKEKDDGMKIYDKDGNRIG